MGTTTYTQEELLEALRYAVSIIDATAEIAKQALDKVPAPQAVGESGLPDDHISAARMLHRSDLRGLSVYGPSNAAALRAIVSGETPKPWFDPLADIRARLRGA